MKKLSGHICDSCRKVFYPDEIVYEFCHDCAHLVWCVINTYANGNKELACIHRTEEGAKNWVEKSKPLIHKMNEGEVNPIVDIEIQNWLVQ